MNILAIETSCDETSASVIKTTDGTSRPSFEILSDPINSQIDYHKEYGGIYPSVAKREHVKNILPVVNKALEQAGCLTTTATNLSTEQIGQIHHQLEREPDLATAFIAWLSQNSVTNVDILAVTFGPGLEPALWIGVQFCKALSIATGLNIIPTNHMHGHIWSGLIDPELEISFPSLALLVSGGHTELIRVNDWYDYELLGSTRDDAIGEAFDKVARILGLEYPGGPKLSRMATEANAQSLPPLADKLPRPMKYTPDYDFSFSGLKTAARLYVEKQPNPENLNKEFKLQFAREFEEAAFDVILHKTKRALEEFDLRTLFIGGGVIANTYLREEVAKITDESGTQLIIPPQLLCLDNAMMIGIAAYITYKNSPNPIVTDMEDLKALGNSSLPTATN